MAEEIAAEYKTSLEDLTFNSKPVINMLTMVAEENIDYAEQIVRVIEERLNKVFQVLEDGSTSSVGCKTLVLVGMLERESRLYQPRTKEVYSNKLAALAVILMKDVMISELQSQLDDKDEEKTQHPHAHPSQKLPVLYLIDSILKNIKNSPYHDLFKTNIVTLFTAVFEKVDEKTRQAMYKLRQTWNDIFDNKILYSLDVRISQIDPAWPITAKPPEVPVTIHVNPKFLTKQKPASPEINERKARKSPSITEKVEHQPQIKSQPEQNDEVVEEEKSEDGDAQALIREQLLTKQQELIRLQQERFKLELMEQMRLQLLQQLVQNESDSCPEVKKEADHKPKVRDPRLTRDPRLANRDPRSVPSSNNNNSNSSSNNNNNNSSRAEKNTDEKGEKLKKSQIVKNTQETTSHISSSGDAKISKQQTKPNDQVTGSKKDVKKKGFIGEEIRNKKEEKKEKPASIKSKLTPEKVTKTISKMNKDVKDQLKEAENKPEEEHVRRTRGSELHEKSKRGDKTSELRQNKIPSQEQPRSKPEPWERQSRSRSPVARNSRSRDSRHTESDEKRIQQRRNQRGGSSLHKGTFDSNSRAEDKKSAHHGSRHIPSKKRREPSPPKKNHDESPPKKRIRQGTGKKEPDDHRLENEDQHYTGREGTDRKMSGDLEDLFGKEDKDYRRLPPIPKLNVSQQHNDDSGSDTMLSPRSAGWSKFKASRPENFPFTQPRSTAVLQRQESTDQFSSPLQSPPTKYQSYRQRFQKHPVHDSEGISPDQAGDILKLAEQQLLNGRLTPEQHRQLVHQLTELHKLQKLKQQIREEKMKISEKHALPPDFLDPAGDTLDAVGTGNVFPKPEVKYPRGILPPPRPRPHRGRVPRMPRPIAQPRYHPYEPEVRRRGPLLPTPRMADDPDSESHPRPVRGPLLPTPDEPAAEMPLDALLPEEEPLVPVAPEVMTPDVQDDRRLPPVSSADDIVRCRDGMVKPRGNQSALLDIDIMAADGDAEVAEYGQHVPKPMKPLLADPPGMSGRPRPIRPQPPIRPVYGPTRPLSKQLDVPHVRPPRPRRMSGITDDSLVGPDHLSDPENTFEPLAYPWYDTELFYCPQHDARWLKRATFVERDKSLYLNINNSKIQLPPHNKSREIYNMMTKLVIKFNEEERKLYINNEEIYTVGELPRMYYYNNKHFEVSIFGPPRSVWLDSVQYQLHEDAPPEPISLGENVYHFQIDSQKNVVIADGHEICPAGGDPKKIQLNYVVHEIRFDPPPRHILLDGKLCELNLKAKFPYLIIDGKPRGVRFNGSPRQIIIDTVPYMVALDKPRKARVLGPRPRLLAFGGPGHEVIIDDMWYEVKFGAPPKEIKVGARTVRIELRGMPPEVKVLGEYVPLEQLTQRVGYPPGPNLAAILPNYVTSTGNVAADTSLPSVVTAAGQMITTTLPVQVGADGQPVTSQLVQSTHPVLSTLTPYQTSAAGDSQAQQQLQLQQQPVAQQPAAPLDVSDLLQRLLKAGIIQPQGSPIPDEKANSDDESRMVERDSVEEIPSLTDFVPNKLKKQYNGAIQLLSVGIQCASCGLRFVPEQKDKYREHLDWHFRQNKRGKDQMNMPKHRDWYYTITEWIQYEEIGDLENRTQSSFFDQSLETGGITNSQGTRIVPGQVISCPAVEGGDDVCAVCGEVFEQFWDEDEEEWHLRDAMRAEDGKTYHPVCYEDVNESNTSLMETQDPHASEPSTSGLTAETPSGQPVSDKPAEMLSDQKLSDTVKEPSPDQSAAENKADVSNGKPVSGQTEPQETDYSKKLLDMVTNPLAYIASLTKQMNQTSSQPDLKAMDETVTSSNSAEISNVVVSSSSLTQSSTMSVTADVSALRQHSPCHREGEPSATAQHAAVASTSIYSTSAGNPEPSQHDAGPSTETSAQTGEQSTVANSSFPITGTPLPTVSSHSSAELSPPAAQSHGLAGGSTPLRDEPLLEAGGSTPVYDEPGTESGRGTPVEDEPMEGSHCDGQSLLMAGSPIVHVITPITSTDQEEPTIKQEP